MTAHVPEPSSPPPAASPHVLTRALDDSPFFQTRPLRVWDLPTRLFHWVFAALMVALVVTGTVGGNALEWHLPMGMAVLALLLWRLIWGLVGGRWSRFASFIYSPATTLRYLRRQGKPGEHFHIGHSPLGALSVFALLGLAALQVATGLVANDDIATTGPLYAHVSEQLSALGTRWHKGPGRWLLIALMLVHVLAIVWWRVKRKLDLVRPMFTGDKALALADAAEPIAPSRDTVTTRLAALAALLACSALAYWIWRLGDAVSSAWGG